MTSPLPGASTTIIFLSVADAEIDGTWDVEEIPVEVPTTILR
jgi:hypothetical protein